jgi:hypothetical protein
MQCIAQVLMSLLVNICHVKSQYVVTLVHAKFCAFGMLYLPFVVNSGFQSMPSTDGGFQKHHGGFDEVNWVISWMK